MTFHSSSPKRRFARHQLKASTVLLVGVLFLGACHSLPDHARYIPKDAVVVAGVNLKSLSKKIAWNVITGSKLFKEMQKRLPEKNANDAVAGIENSGIDFLNTIYCYVKTDKRIKGGNRVSVLVPLSSADDFETYLKKIIPNPAIKTKGDRKEAVINNAMYIGWTKKLLIVSNVTADPGEYYDEIRSGRAAPATTPQDEAEISAEMDNAFTINKENSIINNAHFKTLETDGHDVTLWLNYDQLMSQYMSENMADKMGGLSLSNSLWKDAAFAAGFDFKSGKITGDLNYYVSEELSEIGKDLGGTNADKEMIEQLPKSNLDLLMTWHLSPSGLKKSIDKTGLLGLINLGLGTQGLSFDNIMESFTGDMAIVLNDLSVKTTMETDTLMGKPVSHPSQKPSLGMTVVIKINKKASFDRIFNMYKDAGNLMPTGNNGYTVPIDAKDSVYIIIGEHYAVASNKLANAKGFLDGSFKGHKMPDGAGEHIYGHPLGIFLDIKELVKNIDNGIVTNAHDSAVLAESKRLLDNISIDGGSFKNNSFESHIDINFSNKEESSIIALMDYGMKISDADKLQK